MNRPPESNPASLTIKFTNESRVTTYHFLTARRENRIEAAKKKKEQARKNRSAELDLYNNTRRDYDPVISEQNVEAVEDPRTRYPLLNRTR